VRVDAVPAVRPERSPTRKAEAYERILGMILSGEIGDREYLAEQRLAEAFGMSRAPIREALHALCTERIMESVPRMGYRIAPIGLRELMDCLEVRLLLETESVRLACLNRTPENVERLDDLIVKYERTIEEGEKVLLWINSADSIHLFIAEMSNNVMLARSIAPLIDLIRRVSIHLIHEGRLNPKDQHLHVSILKAVREGESEKARELMREDILTLKKVFLSA